jgi:riboflavin kinase/FMN adenylyltransferase
MRIIKGLKRMKPSAGGACVAIGVFDGVHIGHRAVIRKAVECGRRLRAESVALTFDPHPAKIVGRNAAVPSLISLDHRIRLIEGLGVDRIVILNFTRALADFLPEKFVKNILVEKLGARSVFVGEDFYFGRDNSGNTALLKRLADKYGFSVIVVRPVKALGSIVSSSRVRRLIVSGLFNEASKLMGRPVSVLGTVVNGARIGRRLGYPTANVNPHHEVIPPSGVYAVNVRIGGRPYGGVMNIGAKPTFYAPRDMEPAIEVNIFGFNKRIYGRDIEIHFVKKLRDEIKFNRVEDLVAQIRKDAMIARKTLESAGPGRA